jgi:hypothetical protein
MSLEFFAALLFVGIFTSVVTGFFGILSLVWSTIVQPTLYRIRRQRKSTAGPA